MKSITTTGNVMYSPNGPLLNEAGKISKQENDAYHAETKTTEAIEKSLGNTKNPSEVISREFVKDAMLTEALMPSILPSQRLQDLASLGDRSKDVDRINRANAGDTNAKQEIETIKAMYLATFREEDGVYIEATTNTELKDLFDPVVRPDYSDKPNSIPRTIMWLETVRRDYQRALLIRASKLANPDNSEERLQEQRFYSWVADTRNANKENYQYKPNMLQSADIKDGRFEIPEDMENEVTERFILLSDKIIAARREYLQHFPSESMNTGALNQGQQEVYFNTIVSKALMLNSRDSVPQFIAEQIISRIKKPKQLIRLNQPCNYFQVSQMKNINKLKPYMKKEFKKDKI